PEGEDVDDVPALDLIDRLRLGQESAYGVAVLRRALVQYLHRGAPPEQRVLRVVHGPEAALAELSAEAILACHSPVDVARRAGRDSGSLGHWQLGVPTLARRSVGAGGLASAGAAFELVQDLRHRSSRLRRSIRGARALFEMRKERGAHPFRNDVLQ